MQLLQLEPKKKVQAFDVRYFRVDAPADAPAKASVVLRERSESTGTEVTFKYRAAEPLPSTISWKCPLKNANKFKSEIDVSLSASVLRKTYSWSCSGAGTVATQVPAVLQPKSIGCDSRMTRRESKGTEYKVEEWLLKNGETFVEVSWSASDDAKDQQQFEQQVVAPLLPRIKPLDRSKTEIGSKC